MSQPTSTSSSRLTACRKTVLNSAFKTVTAGTPVAIGTAGVMATQVSLTAMKSSRVANTTPVFWGIGSATGPISRVVPAAGVDMFVTDGTALDLGDIYIDGATSGDQVLVIWHA